MKIAIVQPRTSYYVAGSEKVSLKHAEYLSLLGHDIDFYTSMPQGIEDTFLFKDFIDKKLRNVRIFRFDVSDLASGIYEHKPDAEHVRWSTESIAFSKKIFNSIVQNKPDIILSYYLPDTLFKPDGIPNVLYISGYPSQTIPLYKAFIKFCTATIAISSVVSEKWSEYLTEKHLQYSLGTGVDYPLTYKDKILPKAKFNLVFAGRLIERKGVVTLMQAFKEISIHFVDVHLWVLGDGELLQNLVQMVEHLSLKDKVSVLGLVNNPYDYFSMADVCIFPSLQGDGLMGTVLESMAAGKPVIATFNNGNEDVIESGKNGILINPGDVSGLKQAVINLLNDTEARKRLGESAEKYISEHVSWEKNISKLSDILTDVKQRCS